MMYLLKEHIMLNTTTGLDPQGSKKTTHQ